ncbi:hypothetical protein RGQ15_11135 [Paracoccus sp. MBLB3053]|uniref:Apolipoprotein acyltransferase n=1 Tax=Paracoccus aurantius TaxID=3073814 RepID=A0ABU2HUB2_9RHOB|nr:hypothetical protein [Paracoccus sp. MBLB3053]MDS9468120.1 hypothetical protein [Paracoccus sp. MBLB3053]
MIVITALIIGAAIGWWRAGKLGGTRADRIQYAAVHAMGLAVLGVFLIVLLGRLG